MASVKEQMVQVTLKMERTFEAVIGRDGILTPGQYVDAVIADCRVDKITLKSLEINLDSDSFKDVE